MYKYTEGYWMHFVHQINEILGRTMTEKEVKSAMTSYLIRKTPQQAVGEFK